MLLLTRPKAKLASKAIGSFEIVQVHVNGTITIERVPGVDERVNLRRVKPYHRR